MKNNIKKTAGISLVALVITIIVLIILTGAVIVTFMEDGIMDRAKESVFKNDIRTYQEMLVQKKLLEKMDLNTGDITLEETKIIGQTYEDDTIKTILPVFKEEYGSLIKVVDGEIVSIKELDEKVLEEKWLIELGIGKKAEEEEGDDEGTAHNGLIPEGGTYYVKATAFDLDSNIFTRVGEYPEYIAMYTAGDEFPEPQTGDVYVYGDYEYRYNCYMNFPYWWIDNSMNSWGVRVLDDMKTTYEDFLSEINGKPIVDLRGTFRMCCFMTTAPVIPERITNISHCFYCCESLTGEVEINAINLTDYTHCFFDGDNQVTLTGTCPQLADIAATANYGNVTVKE